MSAEKRIRSPAHPSRSSATKSLKAAYKPRFVRRAGAVGAVLVAALVGTWFLRSVWRPIHVQPGSAAGSNVLLITIDTLRADRVGAYGNASGLTPALDRLAGSGLRFDAAYTAVPMTLPAHASILTGLQPFSHGI